MKSASRHLPLTLAALRWRWATSVSLLVAATLAVAASAAGPLYLSTADGTVLHAHLEAAGASATVVSVGDYVTSSEAAALDHPALALGRQYGLSRWFGQPVWSVTAAMDLPAPMPLVARPGVCSHVHFLVGHCPTTAGQVVLTSRSAQAVGLHLGSTVVPTAPPGVGPVTVVGIIAPGNLANPYWLGQDYFNFGGGSLDAAFTVPATVASLPSTAVAQFPLLPSRVTVGNVAVMEQAVSAYERAATEQLGLTTGSKLFAAVSSYANSGSLMAAIVLVVDLQLVLLALFVIFGLVQRSAEARRREVALAKLRGFRLTRVLSLGLAEPALLTLIALPAGLIVAYAGMAIAQRLALPNSVVLLQPLPVLAGMAAFAGGLIAAVVGVRRTISSRLSDELRAVEPKASGAARAAMDGAALALAVAGIVELLAAGVLNGSQPNPLAAFAPGLVAVAVAIVGVRGLPILASVVVNRTRNSRWMATGLAVRQVVRRPASLLQVTLLAVATGLACFAVTGWAAAGVNRTTRADFVLGAARVLTVQVPAGLNLEHAVERADPSGRHAMAAMLSKTPSENLLAVQVSRLAHVAYWPKDVSRTSLPTLVRWLAPHLQPELVLTGAEVRATITETGNPDPPPDLVFNVVDSGGNPGVADFGFLKSGTHTYTANLPATCTGGCHAVDLEPIWTASSTGPQQVQYSLAISSLQVRTAGTGSWHGVTSRLDDPAYWVSNGPGITATAVGASGRRALLLSVNDQAGQASSPAVIPAALPSTLHGVVTQANGVSDPAAASIENFDGSSLTLDVPYQVAALPQLGYEGFLIDLQTALRAESAPPSQTVDQVWLNANAPSSVEASLLAQGIRVTGVQTPATDIQSMNRGGLALAYLFFLFAAGAAAVLATGAAVFSIFMTSRRRAFELAVLRAIGLSQRTLLRSLLGEQLLVLGPGVVLGIAAGLLGALMALPSVPEFTSLAGGPPVELVFPVLPIVGLVVALVVLLAVAAAFASAATLRLASWDRLRTEMT